MKVIKPMTYQLLGRDRPHKFDYPIVGESEYNFELHDDVQHPEILQCGNHNISILCTKLATRI